MNILEIIDKKRINKELSYEELDTAFNGYLKKEVEDYQMSSLLMAICINGMSREETVNLTDLMLNSGERLDTSIIDGILVDKHSTGGVGDKTSLIIGPILASLGLKVGKLSGRGLGFTGGTIDKLESIPGFRVSLAKEEFIDNINKVGFTLMMQTPEITPMDKAIYELRNASGTTSSIPLIASSIMSKKLAIGAKYILIDIKVGGGALIKAKEDAYALADIMINIGASYNVEVIPVLTDMDSPLGDNIGNALEIKEAMDVLKGKSGHLTDISIELSSILYSKSMNVDKSIAEERVKNVLSNGSAYNKFLEFVKNQGGNIEKLSISSNIQEIKSDKDGTVESISASKIGYLSMILGGGRMKKGAEVDYGVGIVLKKHIGDAVQKGDILCYIYRRDEKDYSEYVKDAYTIVK